MYKSLSLAALLLPFLCHGITKEARIKELKEAQYQKMLELSSLMDIICKTRDSFQSKFSAYENALQNSARERKEKLDALAEKNGRKKIDIDKIRGELDASNNLICNDLLAALFNKKEFKHSIFHELFDLENTTPVSTQTFGVLHDFYADKFLAVGAVMESSFIVIAIARYDQCVQELITMNKEIINLEA